MANHGDGVYRYSYRELSGFCMQISLLLAAAVPLDEGLSIMAEDASGVRERELLVCMAEGVEHGIPFFKVLEDTGAFPGYVVKMAKLGQQTGSLDQMMESLSRYYEKEYSLMQAVKNALTYPVMMVVMLLVVLFVLFTQVMPVFSKVYEQLGATMSPVADSAVRLGAVFSGGALLVSVLLALVIGGVWLASRSGRKPGFAERFMNWLKGRSRIALAVANRRFTAVLALTLRSGMELEKGMELAGELVANETVAGRIVACSRQLQAGEGYYKSMKDTGLFTGFHIQMIKVGSRSGHLDRVMEKISGDYEEMAEAFIDSMLARFEPTVVAVLAVSVGLVLLSVMLPLIGILSAIG